LGSKKIRILDSHGQPIGTQFAAGETSSIGGPRATLENDPTNGYMLGRRLANPNYLLSNLGKSTEVFEEMRRRPSILAPTQIRMAAIAGLDWKIVPATEEPIDIERADEMKKQLEGITNFEAAIGHLNLAPGDGYSVIEVIKYKDTDPNQIVDELAGRSSYRFQFDIDNNIYLLTKDNPYDGELQPREKYIVAINGRKPYGDGYLAALYFLEYYGVCVEKDEYIWLDKRAVETVYAILNDIADDDARDSVLKILGLMQNSGNAVYPNGTEIHTLTEGRSETNNIFESVHARREKTAQRIILGTELTGFGKDGGGSFALAKTLKGVSYDSVLLPDARKRQSEINSQLIPLIARRLWLADRPLPRFEFDAELKASPDEDFKRAQTMRMRMEIAFKWRAAVPIKYFYEELGIPMPEDVDPDETIVPPAPQAPAIPAIPVKEIPKDTKAIARFSAKYIACDEIKSEFAARRNISIETLTADALAEADMHHKVIVRAIQKAIEKSKGWDDLRGRISTAIPEKSIGKLDKIYAAMIGKTAYRAASNVREQALREAKIYNPGNYAATFAADPIIRIGEVTIEPVVFEEAAAVWKEAGYYASRLTKVHMGTALEESITGAIERGELFGDFQQRVYDELGRDGFGALKPGYLKMVYRTNLSNAYSAGRYQQMQLPGMKKFFPWAVYVTAGDDQVRPEHADFDGVKKPIDDPWWSNHTGPLTPNCRCDQDLINRYQAAEIDPATTKQPPLIDSENAVARGFGNPGRYIENLQSAALNQGIPPYQGARMPGSFSDYDAADAAIKKMTLPDAEKNAIKDYTGEGYKKLNRNLIDNKKLTDAQKLLSTNVDKALDHLPTYSGDTYRGIKFFESDASRFGRFWNMQPGDKVSFPAFTSTTINPTVAQDLAIDAADSVIFTIKSKSGKIIDGLSKFAYEKEVLYKRGSTFRVLATTGEDAGYGYKLARITLEEI